MPTWLKTGRDFPTTKVTIDVDGAGRQVGYFGPDYTPPPVDSHVELSRLVHGLEGRRHEDDHRRSAAVRLGRQLERTLSLVRSRARRMRLTKLADRCADRIAIFAGTWKKVAVAGRSFRVSERRSTR